MKDEPKTKTLIEEFTIAEVIPPVPPELDSETTTAIAPVRPSSSGGSAAEAGAPASTGTEPENPGVSEPEKKAFDPYRFQRMTVPPGLRSEMAQVKLPRLSDEYFKETLPPATMQAAGESSQAGRETADSREPVSSSGSDGPTVFEPIERTPTSLSLPMTSTPRTLFWSGLGLLVGVILLFVAREITKDEPRLAMSPPETQGSAPRGSASSTSLGEISPPLPEETALLAAEVALPSALTSAPQPSASAMSSARPRKPSTPTSAASSAQSPASNSKRLWITPR
jgi:hypothetical protein